MLKIVNNKRFIVPPVIKSLKTDQRTNNTLLSFLLMFKFKKWTFVNHHLEAVHQPAAEVKTFWRAWRSLSSTAVWRGVRDHMTNVPPNVKCCDQMSRWSFHTIFYEYIFWLLLNYSKFKFSKCLLAFWNPTQAVDDITAEGEEEKRNINSSSRSALLPDVPTVWRLKLQACSPDLIILFL